MVEAGAGVVSSVGMRCGVTISVFAARTYDLYVHRTTSGWCGLPLRRSGVCEILWVVFLMSWMVFVIGVECMSVGGHACGLEASIFHLFPEV